MKICNCLTCFCCCPTWFGGCCMWTCTLSIAGFCTQHLNKRSGLWLILTILLFWCTPFLCIAGIVNWILSVTIGCDNCKAQLDSGNPIQGFHDLVIPDPSGGEGAKKCFNFVDKICKT